MRRVLASERNDRAISRLHTMPLALIKIDRVVRKPCPETHADIIAAACKCRLNHLRGMTWI